MNLFGATHGLMFGKYPAALQRLFNQAPKSLGFCLSEDNSESGNLIPVLYFDNFSSHNVAVDFGSAVMRTSSGRQLEDHALFLASKLEEIKAAGFDIPKVLLVVNSPGGAVTEFTGPYHALMDLRRALGRTFPSATLEVVGDRIMASGGYMLGAAGHVIKVPEGCYIGSIGVVAQAPNVFSFLDKLGIKVEVVTAGQRKRTLHPYVAPEDFSAARGEFANDLEKVHVFFKYVVSKSRPKLAPEAMDGTAMVAYVATQPGQETYSGLFDELIQSPGAYLAQIAQDGRLVHLGSRPAGRLGRFAWKATSLIGRIASLFTNGPTVEIRAVGFYPFSG
jgi:hypothetical protein